MEAIRKAHLASEAALDNKASDVVIVDMRAVSNVTEYFVICSAPSARRVQAIARGIKEALAKHDATHWHTEGKREALWVLVDYGDVIAHIFLDKTREFYNLERLWHDAPKEYFHSRCTQAKFKKD